MKHVLFALAALASLPASAEIVTYEYTGIVNHLREYNGNIEHSRGVVSSAVIDGGLRIGDTFRGVFSYDTTNYQVLPWAGTGVGVSQPVDAADASFTVTHSGTTVNATRFGAVDVIDVAPGAGSDRLQIGPTVSWFPNASVGFYFEDATATLLSGATIPGTLNLADWYSATAKVTWNGDGKSLLVDGMLTSLTKVSPVPEPSTWALLFAGLAIVAGGAARKRNRILPLQD